MNKNQGIIFAPYITAQTVSLISESQTTASFKVLKSRYSVTNVLDKNYYQMMIEKELMEERRNKLEKIINNIKNKV